MRLRHDTFWLLRSCISVWRRAAAAPNAWYFDSGARAPVYGRQTRYPDA